MPTKPTTNRTRARTDERVRNFDLLPEAALVDTHTVCALFQRSRESIRRDVGEGALPRPVRVGNAVRYRVGDLRRHIARQQAEV